jgi:excinuclease ABC subunit B
VILYADGVTDSMKRAMDETERRRRLQAAFNKKHGITPQTIIKALSSPLVKIYDADYVDIPLAAEGAAPYRPGELNRKVRKLQKEMKEAAQKLEFERAAELRDQLRQLQSQELTLRDSPLDPITESD